jgi:hypothetical protein
LTWSVSASADASWSVLFVFVPDWVCSTSPPYEADASCDPSAVWDVVFALVAAWSVDAELACSPPPALACSLEAPAVADCVVVLSLELVWLCVTPSLATAGPAPSAMARTVADSTRTRLRNIFCSSEWVDRSAPDGSHGAL